MPDQDEEKRRSEEYLAYSQSQQPEVNPALWTALVAYRLHEDGLPAASAHLLADLRHVLRQWGISFDDAVYSSREIVTRRRTNEA